MAQTNKVGEASPHWRVWATRPSAQNTHWIKRLQKAGYETFDIPLLTIQAVQDPTQIQAVKNIILDFDEFNKVIFVSQNAVNHTVEWLDEYWPQYPVNIDYLAVGEKTAQCATKFGLVIKHAKGAMNTDALLALPELQQVQHDKILICRGAGGLPRLGEALQARGAHVKYCELYERLLPTEAFQTLSANISKLETRDIFIVFSGESLTNLNTLLEKAKLSGKDQQLIVPGERVADMARALGYKKVVAAENASEDTMFSVLKQLNISTL